MSDEFDDDHSNDRECKAVDDDVADAVDDGDVVDRSHRRQFERVSCSMLAENSPAKVDD